jgi:hypothetical protein
VWRLYVGNSLPFDTAQDVPEVFGHHLTKFSGDSLYIYFFPCGTYAPFRVMASPYKSSRLHELVTQHSLGILWTSDQHDAEDST